MEITFSDSERAGLLCSCVLGAFTFFRNCFCHASVFNYVSNKIQVTVSTTTVFLKAHLIEH